MLEHGGIISEFESGTKPDRENFPQRNRIVAGMSDVTIVVESADKRGLTNHGTLGRRLQPRCDGLFRGPINATLFQRMQLVD